MKCFVNYKNFKIFFNNYVELKKKNSLFASRSKLIFHQRKILECFTEQQSLKNPVNCCLKNILIFFINYCYK